MMTPLELRKLRFMFELLCSDVVKNDGKLYGWDDGCVYLTVDGMYLRYNPQRFRVEEMDGGGHTAKPINSER